MVVAKDSSSFANDAYLASNDYFYEDELYEAKDYTFAVLPDIQMITLFYPEMVSTIPQYLLNNESKQKIEAVFTVGDLTNGQHSKGSSFDKQYKVIRDQFAKLDGHMPYMFVPGNHDYDDECKTNRNLTRKSNGFFKESKGKIRAKTPPSADEKNSRFNEISARAVRKERYKSMPSNRKFCKKTYST
jgi:predicted MPP superfamily phosphohydrolase